MQQPTPLRPRRTSFIHWLPWIAVLAFSVVSFVATSNGFYAIFSGAGASDLRAWTLSALATSGIQLLLIYAVYRHKAESTRRARMRWFVVYGVVAFVSVTFGIGYWAHLLESRAWAQQDRDAQMEGLILTGEKFVRSYDALSADLSHLATYSQETALRESTEGSTCGYPTPGIRGPRAILRENDARTTATYQTHVAQENETIESLLVSMRQLIGGFDETQMETYRAKAVEVFAYLEAARTDPKLQQLESWLDSRLDQSQNGFVVEGKEFACPDPVFDQISTDVLASLQSLPQVTDPADQELWDPRSPAQAVSFALDRILVQPIQRLASANPRQYLPSGREAMVNERRQAIRDASQATPVSTARSLPVLPIVLGSVIDLLIYLAASPRIRRARRDAPVLPDVLETVMELLPDDMTIERMRSIVFRGLPLGLDLGRAIDSRHVRVGGRDYVRIEPAETPSVEDTAVRRLMDVLVLSDKARVMSDEGPFGVRRLLHAHPGAPEPEQRRPLVWMLEKGVRIEEVRLGGTYLTKQVLVEVA